MCGLAARSFFRSWSLQYAYTCWLSELREKTKKPRLFQKSRKHTKKNTFWDKENLPNTINLAKCPKNLFLTCFLTFYFVFRKIPTVLILFRLFCRNSHNQTKTACFRLGTRNFSKKLFQYPVLSIPGENLMKIHKTVQLDSKKPEHRLTIFTSARKSHGKAAGRISEYANRPQKSPSSFQFWFHFW